MRDGSAKKSGWIWSRKRKRTKTSAPIERTPATLRAPEAYGYPLLIKTLLESGIAAAPDQTIVYADKKRSTYRELGQRIGRLASGLASLGVRPGNTVAVMDWDSHRYLECFFAVPMMGAVLRHINPRLSPEQILSQSTTPETMFCSSTATSCPLIREIWNRVEPGKNIEFLADTAQEPATPWMRFAGMKKATRLPSRRGSCFYEPFSGSPISMPSALIACHPVREGKSGAPLKPGLTT